MLESTSLPLICIIWITEMQVSMQVNFHVNLQIRCFTILAMQYALALQHDIWKDSIFFT